MLDAYSGWTITIPEAEIWRNSAHCPDKYKVGKPYTPGDVSALHALLDRFLADLGVQKYVFPEIIHRPMIHAANTPEAGERVIIFARRHDDNPEPLLENAFDLCVRLYLERAGFSTLSPTGHSPAVLTTIAKGARYYTSTQPPNQP
ncbi:hypothetical protein RSOLAG1IB_09563 [Rhizoctonia solani AG-1 IB]|uniref:Uncharacterized protein n=1 Tax=Thanatephorus cucumeris (strain AG1-IB / isolate 7/3/14) TaxID=1108050 RepID=A0A0B7FRN2_THACB|nr:hypothetical protein RSOLAG1IB_09563 [Rhizoctonia solani AG-1 IB]